MGAPLITKSSGRVEKMPRGFMVLERRYPKEHGRALRTSIDKRHVPASCLEALAVTPNLLPSPQVEVRRVSPEEEERLQPQPMMAVQSGPSWCSEIWSRVGLIIR